jgi:hypothetical protein
MHEQGFLGPEAVVGKNPTKPSSLALTLSFSNSILCSLCSEAVWAVVRHVVGMKFRSPHVIAFFLIAPVKQYDPCYRYSLRQMRDYHITVPRA